MPFSRNAEAHLVKLGLAEFGLPSSAFGSALSAAVLVFLTALAGTRIIPAHLRADAHRFGFFNGGRGFADDITALRGTIALSWRGIGVA